MFFSKRILYPILLKYCLNQKNSMKSRLRIGRKFLLFAIVTNTTNNKQIVTK